MGTFSALMAICAGNSSVTGEFPAQRPVTRNFDVFFDRRLNKQLSKQWWVWWFETPSRPLWRHCNALIMWNFYGLRQIVSNIAISLWWRHNDHDNVSNHQPREGLLNRSFRRRSKKTSKVRVTGLCVWNSPGPVNSPQKGQLRGKCFHLMTSSWLTSVCVLTTFFTNGSIPWYAQVFEITLVDILLSTFSCSEHNKIII